MMLQDYSIQTANVLQASSSVRQRLLFSTFCVVMPQFSKFVICDLYRAFAMTLRIFFLFRLIVPAR